MQGGCDIEAHLSCANKSHPESSRRSNNPGTLFGTELDLDIALHICGKLCSSSLSGSESVHSDGLMLDLPLDKEGYR